MVWKVRVSFQTEKQKCSGVRADVSVSEFVFALCYVLCAVIFLTPVRGFLVVTVVRGEGGPVPALLYARTATWYRVLGRSPDTLAVGSRPAVLTRSAAASLSCCRQYRIC